MLASGAPASPLRGKIYDTGHAVESTKLLRQVCQETRDDTHNQRDWLDRAILRRVSIYATRVLLRAGVSPNQVTLLSLLPAVAAGAMLAMPQPVYWLAAWGALLLFEILDCCDGEVARYRGSASLVGEYNDHMAGLFFLYPFVRACMAFGVYRALENVAALALGFVIVVGWMVFRLSPILCDLLVYRTGKPLEDTGKGAQSEPSRGLLRSAAKYGQGLFGHTSFFLALLVISLVDMFVSPFAVGSLEVNIRFVYLALLALVMVLAALLAVSNVNRYGVRLRK